MRTTWLAALWLPLSITLWAQAVAAEVPAAEQAIGVPQEEVRAVVGTLATALEENFVFPEVGAAYAAMLRERLTGGAYANILTKDAFAEAVTSDLQAFQKEGHLRLFAPKVEGGKSKYRTAPSADGAIGRCGWLSEGVAYIEITMFPGDAATLDKIDTFLKTHSVAETLIIDLRAHHGGDIKEAELIGSYLFADDALFAHMDTRAAVDAAGDGAFEDSPTMRRIDGPEGVVRRAHVVSPGPATPLREASIYLLTSKKTGSAAEGFAMALKRTGRAVLLGETTRGAGHFGDQYPLPNGYSAFIPVGRSFDPTTGEGWEGTGVKPHLEVPADKALDVALRLAGVDSSAELALANMD